MIFERSRKIGRMTPNAFRSAKYADEHERDRDTGHCCADANENHQSDGCSQQSSQKLHESCPDQVSHTLHIVHDSRNESPGFVGVVIGDRQASNVFLYLAAELGNQPLGSLRKQLSQRE